MTDAQLRTLRWLLVPMLWAGSAPLALAQYGTTNGTTNTTTGTGGTVGSTTPGVPNTGVGGDPTNLLAILGIAAVVVIAGGAYLLWEGGQQS